MVLAGAGTKRCLPRRQLMREQTALPTPGMQGLTHQAMTFLQGRQTLRQRPIVRSLCRLRPPELYSRHRLFHPTLQRVVIDIQLVRDRTDRPLVTLEDLLEGLLLEALGIR